MRRLLGGVADRLPRRTLVVGLESARAAILLATPFLIGAHSRWWLIYPILLFLACINAVVQPARQAAIPGLVPAGQVGKANAMVAATTVLAGCVGFGLAGAFFARSPQCTHMPFLCDPIPFALAPPKCVWTFTVRNRGCPIHCLDRQPHICSRQPNRHR